MLPELNLNSLFFIFLYNVIIIKLMLKLIKH